jgi:sec-independent protein translocase protein TatA
MLFLGTPELFVIVIVIIMLFGADKIPEIAQNLGKGIKQVKNATNEVKREINKSAKYHGLDTDFVKELKEDVDTVKKNVNDNLEDLTGPIKRSR